MALYCVVGDRGFPKHKRDLAFRFVGVNLDGFEDWLRIGSIQIQRGKIALQAKYHHPKQIDYSLSDGKLSLIFDLSGPFFGRSRRHKLELVGVRL
jgi:hypothetical protein